MHFFTLISLFFSLILPAWAEPAAQKIYLQSGENYPLPGFNEENLQIVPQSVVSAHRTADGVLLVAHSPGTARLFVNGSKDARAELIVRDNARSLRKKNTSSRTNIASFLRQIPGLKVTDIGGKTVVQGRIYGRAQYQRLLFSLAQKPNAIVLATAPNAVKDSLILQAKQLFKKAGIEGAEIGYAGNRFFLEGQVSSPTQLDRAYVLASSVIANIENHIPVPLIVDPTITIHVFLLELSRRAHWALGLHWPMGASNAITASPAQLVFGPSWSAQLEHLSQNGEARVLAEPTLAVKKGSSAELKAGGEIPIRLLGKFENKVIWKEYGLRLNVHIVGTAGDRIRTRIETSSSQLDESTSVDGVPGIRNNTLKTEIDAKENQPILLTGLFQSGQSKDVEKIPLLGDIPLLGELFKSRRFRNHESELLVALLPRFGVTEASLPLNSARGLDFDFKWRPLD